MYLRVLLNGITLNRLPKEIEQLEEQRGLDLDVKGFYYQINCNLTWDGQAYDIIENFLKDNPRCSDITCVFQFFDNQNFVGTVGKQIKGIIKAAELQHDRVRKTYKGQVIDNGFFNWIDSNKNLEFDLTLNQSKNGLPITGRNNPTENVYLFSPVSGRYFYEEFTTTLPDGDEIDLRIQPRAGYYIWDLLDTLVARMSDNKMGFKSDYFDRANNEDAAYCMIMLGKDIKTGSRFYPKISFQDLMNDLYSMFNVVYDIEDYNTPRPVLRVEPRQYFQQINSNKYIQNFKEAVEKTNVEMLYNQVNFGCVVSKPKLNYIPTLEMGSHEQANYIFEGNCNLQKTLDLRNKKIIINDNSICEILPSISGFNTGDLVLRKYADTVYSANTITETTEDISLIATGDIIVNEQTGKVTYVTYVDGNIINIQDDIFDVGVFPFFGAYKPSNDDGLFDENFLIQINKNTLDIPDLGDCNATKLSITDVHYGYNSIVHNGNVCNRHDVDIINYFNYIQPNVDDKFRAQYNSGGFVNVQNLTIGGFGSSYVNVDWRKVPFPNDFSLPAFDSSNNYDVSNAEFIAPRDGLYYAKANLFIRVDSTGVDSIFQLAIVHYTVSGDVLNFEEYPPVQVNVGATDTVVIDNGFVMEKGDKLAVIARRIRDANIPFNYYAWGDNTPVAQILSSTPNMSYFEVYEYYNSVPFEQNPPKGMFKFIDIEHQITAAEDKSIAQDIFKAFTIKFGQNDYEHSYIDFYKHNPITGKTNIKCRIR